MTLYVYALVDASLRGSALGRGVARAPIRVVRVASFWAVVETGAAPEPTAKMLVAHDRVVRRIARLAPATLPMRFGTSVADRAALSAALASREPAIARALERVRGAVQLTLRVRGRRARPRVPRSAGPGARFLALRAARYRVPEIDVVTTATMPFVREDKVERHDDGARLASVYHLVARVDLRAWRAAFRSASAKLAGVTITATGPWPPYAFAELDGEP